LSDNNIVRERYTTIDFVKFKGPLRLGEYTAFLARYPWMDGFKPFESWLDKNPSDSLSWFDAYNKLKYDKIGSQLFATMKNAIEAALAYWIAFQAIFGDAVEGKFFDDGMANFALYERPRWNWGEFYFEPDQGEQWHPKFLKP
jgi:hypothetical protein